MLEHKVFNQVNLDADDVVFLKKLAGDLPILADLCRADLLLYCKAGAKKAITVAQARPHSFSSLCEDTRVGSRVSVRQQSEVLRSLDDRPRPHLVHTVTIHGAAVARQVFPVRNAHRKLIAVMTKDAFWLAHERHRRRHKAFQDALFDFILMVLRGDLRGAESLTPFGEHDGIVYVGADRRIQYMSGIASELYRHLGYRDSLVGRRVTDIETVDRQMVQKAAAERHCLELKVEQDGLTWTRKVLPITAADESLLAGLVRRMRPRAPSLPRPRGVFILIHDETEAIKTRRELESKMAMVREVHHRVKNNLQIIASIMRMQARRVSGDEARAVLEESMGRILSVAVVHEFLSRNAEGTINLRDVANRIVGQIQQGLIDPEKCMHLSVTGPDIWLPAERATQCALVINELVQNAIEHGMAHRDEGNVKVELIDDGEKISIIVMDDGRGLPEGFNMEADANLGLRIVQSMVERDLRGEFILLGTVGTQAIVRFEKSV